MEPRPKAKMPQSPVEPIVRAVVFNTLNEIIATKGGWGTNELAAFIASRLCEHIDADGWDECDRIRKASTKLTWGYDPIDEVGP